jgi:glycosyltransferase involved in cell wall biosynthesis
MDKRGHHYEYVKSVYDEWIARGFSAAVYCHRNAEADINSYFDARGIFSRSIHTHSRTVPGLGKANLLVNFLVSNYIFYKELKKTELSAGDTNDIFLFHTIDPNQLFGLYFWYYFIKSKNRPCLVLIFRLGAGDNPGTRRYATFLYRLFFRSSTFIAEGKMVFFSDSRNLAAEYQALKADRISVLPIPHIPDARVDGVASPNDKYVIVYPGEARIEKGYHLLPRVIENLISKRGDVRFVIQSNVSGNPSQEVLEGRTRIKALKKDVEYTDRILESGEYYEIIRKADAILLPYSPETYRSRTSGIFAEAIAFAKPVIVPGGTWMERQVTEFGHCGTVMDRYDEESLEKAIEAMLDDYEEYRNRAIIASGRWKKFHNARTYVDMLIGAMDECFSNG